MPSTYAFIGGGNMGRALVGGLVAAGHDAAHIRVADASPDARAACTTQFGVATGDDILACARDADVVVLAVKPQQLREVARALGGESDDGTLYLSIAAGITVGHLEAWLGHGRAIVRAMPNTPALIGSGAAALYANAVVDDAQRALADGLLGAVGSAVWVEDEALMDAVTALSGSGPAYVFLLIELMERAGAELGLPPALARSLALDTVHGAARLAHASGQSPAELRVQVTSPGGTTERALASFAADELPAIVSRALTAARDRAVELAAGIER
ncbi:MAG: pyrroline-5-carboxylate reductase [Gammaproteobacteria bacterium]|nr:pyrroline-5-carboxylate reductase [Gammaproteobacteria bacterium]MCP5200506.1 pyrroline-5-carboxylate reductase [Gammaproteobacteria bacterium]